jgi:hypothetical protein
MPIMRTGFMAVLSIALVAACSSGGLAPKPAPAPTPSGPKFEGIYRFDFDGTQQLAGGAPKPTQSRSRSYAVRSNCTDTDCIATATRLADNDPKRRSDPPIDLIFDYFDGSWHMVHREDSTCTDGDTKGPSITAWVLQQQPDGALTGISYVAMNPSPECAVATQTPITVTRVGDRDSGIAVPDPGKQPPRSPSAPEGLSGHYSETSVVQGGSKPGVRRVGMQTMCVRNSTDCMTFKSYLTASETSVVNSLVFSNGKWRLHQRTDVNCPDGTTAATVKHEEYALPQSVAYPLPRITGTMSFDAANSCPAQQLDITLERTGD